MSCCLGSVDGRHHYHRQLPSRLKRQRRVERERHSLLGDKLTWIVYCRDCALPAFVTLRSRGLLGNHASIREVVFP